MRKEEFDRLRSLRPNGGSADELVRDRLPRIVLVGGPSAGKSSSRKRLAQDFAGEVHCLPEAHAWMVRTCGIRPPPNPILDLVHMREHSRIRRSLEILADVQARVDRKKAVVVDRGLFDAAAYRFLVGPDDAFPHGPVQELMHLLETTLEDELAHYDLVIYLEMVSEPTFVAKNEEARRKGKLARSENYERACLIADQLRVIWGHHPNLVSVPDPDDFEAKYAAVRLHVRSFIDRLP